MALAESTRIPLEAKGFQLGNAIGIDAGALSLDKLAPFAALMLAPGAQGLVGIRHIDMATSGLEVLQGAIVLVPAGGVRLPDETNLLESLQARFRQCGVLSLFA